MKLTQKILLFVLLLAIISTIANSLGFNNLLLITRQSIIPLLLLYYYKSVNKIYWIAVVILFLNWLSDWVNFTSFKNFNVLLIIGILYYSLFFIEGLKNSQKFKATFINILSLFIVVVSISFLYINVIELALLELSNHKILLSIYAFMLSLIIILASFHLNFRNSNNDLNYFFCASAFFLSDIFYLINDFFVKHQFVVILNFAVQVLSYYFIVRYFIYIEKNKESNKDQTIMLFP
jgi:hypothetical protein